MNSQNHKKLIVIAGPTAVGKTAVAIRLAKVLKAEVVSADSRQLYQEMSIGTAKPSAEELSEVKHHFIDVCPITEDYDAARFGREALAVIHKLFKTSDQVILCGGSGLYIQAVCEGFDEIPSVADEVRESLVKGFDEYGLAWLQQKMQELDPQLLAVIDRQNPHRLIRALEVKIGTGMSIADFRKKEKLQHDFRIVKIGLELPREVLYQRIDERMDKMIEAGLFAEAQNLYPFKVKNALQTVGYQEIFDFIDKQYDYDEAVRLLKRNSRRYAKRQMTWFKRDDTIRWFSPLQVDDIIDHIMNAQ
jgi:tRNA dimethylallyltransferase